MKTTARSSAKITYTTWKALFLHSAVNTLSKEKLAWFWLLAEPILHIAVLILVFTVIRVRTIGGINTAVWLMAGLLAFFMFRRTAVSASIAIKSSSKLFTYPQIRPIDPVLVQAGLEGFLMAIVTLVLLTGAWLFGLDVIPDDPLAVIVAFFGLWLFGVGFGLICSVAIVLIPPLGAGLSFILRPLYFISGVLWPIGLIPYPYHNWLMLNPVAHALEAARLGFAPYYHVTSDLNIAYLYGWALVSIFLGIALQVRYAKRLM